MPRQHDPDGRLRWSATLKEQNSAATLTLSELQAERGRVFIDEEKRRPDMIWYVAFTTASW